MSAAPEHIVARVGHARRGAIRNAFTYRADYVLIDPEAPAPRSWLFGRNRRALFAIHDRHHGGARGAGRGAPWARETLAQAGLDEAELRLLAHPAFLGRVFNPVSFWMAFRGGALVAVIAEVNNTFGDRHSYLIHNPGFAPITATDRPEARKLMHVSPFQDVAGDYSFTFDIREDRLKVRIRYTDGDEGLIATMAGARRPLSDAGLARAALARPLGAWRTPILIHWQALVLALKGARYRPRPEPPETEISECSY